MAKTKSFKRNTSKAKIIIFVLACVLLVGAVVGGVVGGIKHNKSKTVNSPISKHVHTEIVDIGKVATCIETGLTDGKHCTTCGKVLVERTVIPISDHSYISDCCKFCGLDRSGYYLVGTFNDWQWSDKYKFEPYIIPPENSTVKEQKKLTVTLDEGAQFKIWKGNGDWSYSYSDNYGVQDGYGRYVWDDYLTIADDSLTNCEIFTITQSGTYTIYLKFFSDGGGSIYVGQNSVMAGEQS